MLAGCATSNNQKLAGVSLPPLPAHLASRCADPGVKAGDPIAELARQRQALAQCSHAKRDLVAYYDDVARRYRGK